MKFFQHTNEDGSVCLATVVKDEDGVEQKILIDKDSEVEYYKDIKKKAKNKNSPKPKK